MKKLIVCLGVAFLATVIHAGSFLQLNLPTNDVNQITLALYPSYAPGLTTGDGEKAEWGAGAALLYPVATPYTLLGVRADWLADDFWGANVTLTLQLPIKVLGVPVTPFAIAGAAFQISDLENEDANVSPLFGGGAYVTVWRPSANTSLQLFFCYERWVQFERDIYHPGAAFTLKF